MAYTRAQVRDLIRQRCTLENTSAQTNAELNNLINDASRNAHDFLVATLGEHYDVKSTTVATVAGTASYTIAAADFDKLLRASLRFDDRDIPMMPFSRSDRTRLTRGHSWGPGYMPKYNIRKSSAGVYTIEFDPPPDTIQTVYLDYHPTAPQYANDSDVVGMPYPELLITEACILVKVKDQRDASFFISEREVIHKRIEDWAGTLDQGMPWRVQTPGRSYRNWRDRVF